MCGRIAQAAAIRKTEQLLRILKRFELPPRFNIAPSQPAAVVRSDAEGNLEWALPRWGLVPHWAKEPKTGYKMINAKAETVAEKPAYRGPFRHRRCIVPVDGFYEWKEEGKVKQPYFIHFRDQTPVFLAGLWDHWQGDGQDLETFTVLTTTANKLLDFHDRMPVILTPEDVTTWLDPKIQSKAPLEHLLRPFSEGNMETYPVDRRVNKPSFDDPACVIPVH